MALGRENSSRKDRLSVSDRNVEEKTCDSRREGWSQECDGGVGLMGIILRPNNYV